VILAWCVSALIFEQMFDFELFTTNSGSFDAPKPSDFANAGALRECLNIEDFAENFKSHRRLFQLTAQADP
jgi:hypothetical protein